MPRLPPPQTAAWPSVSAIVATRDRPALLTRAVRGMLGQTYPGEVECVVVFDQSSPVPLLVDVPARRRLRVVTNTRTPGLAGARNTGIAASDGALVAFCDDDDVWAPDKLRLQVEQLKATGAEFVASGVRIHHGDQVVERLPPGRRRAQPAGPRAGLRAAPFDLRHPAGRAGQPRAGRRAASRQLRRGLRLAAARGAAGPIATVQQPLVEVLLASAVVLRRALGGDRGRARLPARQASGTDRDRRGQARIEGQIAFAQAALAHRRAAWRASWHALRGNPRERRAYLALAVASGLVSATSIVRLANRRGRGI